MKKIPSKKTGKIPKEFDTVSVQKSISAPGNQVFKMWSDPEQMLKWWAPADYNFPYHNIDFKIGGPIVFCMNSPKGRDHWWVGEYKEIVEDKRIVLIDYCDSINSDNHCPGNQELSDNGKTCDKLNHKSMITVDFIETKNGTTIKLNQTGVPIQELRDEIQKGWEEGLERLELFLAANQSR